VLRSEGWILDVREAASPAWVCPACARPEDKLEAAKEAQRGLTENVLKLRKELEAAKWEIIRLERLRALDAARENMPDCQPPSCRCQFPPRLEDELAEAKLEIVRLDTALGGAQAEAGLLRQRLEKGFKKRFWRATH